MQPKRTEPTPRPDPGLPSRESDRLPAGELDRRAMLKLMGASAALSVGIVGCDRKPARKIISRVDPPEYLKPGKALYYASTWTEGTVPYGMLVKAVDGRPIAIEGLEGGALEKGELAHPINAGRSSSQMKAAILSLYDPDRLRAPLQRGKAGEKGTAIAWQQVDEQVSAALGKAGASAVITRSTLGPSERALLERLQKARPGLRHLVHESVHDRERRAAWEQLFGAPGELVPRFDQARVILSLGSDFLGTDGAVLEATRRFAALRAPATPGGAMSRLWVAEGAMTLTGMNADHRIPLRPSALPALAAALRAAATGKKQALKDLAAGQKLDLAVLEALVKDLRANKRHAVVVAGPNLPAAAHAEVALLNELLGAPGKTLDWNPTPHALPVTPPAEIAAALAGGVDVLILLGVNPVHDFPGGGFEKLLAKARFSIGCDLYESETLEACHLALPDAHNLEAWNDAAPRPGLATLCQPVIRPLFGARQGADSLLIWTRALEGEGTELAQFADWYAFLKARWQREVLPDDGERTWERALRAGGLLEASALAAPKLVRAKAEELAGQVAPVGAGYELAIQPHHALHDGRFANISWLQELPDPVARLVWDNAASIGAHTAKVLGVAEGDMLRLRSGGAEVDLPVQIQPGTADGVIALTLGHGRRAGGSVAKGVGFAVAPLAGAGKVEVSKTTGWHQLVRTQKEFDMHGRPIALDTTLEAYRENPEVVKTLRHLPPEVKLHDEFVYSGAKWGMAIDLSCCTGCGACVTACQAENNIPVVGKDQVSRGREMHWIRIDLYREGDEANPTFHRQPLPCQHCDNAPCENVCPVQATTQSPEGINEMTYNRCVGTRYCANNCPYKVRRFNFLDYSDMRLKDKVQELVFNPMVTVRDKGVMEKCTFCIQRINAVRHEQKNKGEFEPKDGSIQTACQQSCPASAIAFGNLNDPESRVAKLHRENRAYKLLEELHVKPAVAYLAKVRNPHPDLAPKTPPGGGEHEGGAH